MNSLVTYNDVINSLVQLIKTKCQNVDHDTNWCELSYGDVVTWTQTTTHPHIHNFQTDRYGITQNGFTSIGKVSSLIVSNRVIKLFTQNNLPTTHDVITVDDVYIIAYIVIKFIHDTFISYNGVQRNDDKFDMYVKFEFDQSVNDFDYKDDLSKQEINYKITGGLNQFWEKMVGNLVNIIDPEKKKVSTYTGWGTW